MHKNSSVLSIDFGLSRIGIAVANVVLKIPHPIAVITGRNILEKNKKLATIINEWKPIVIVIGKPTFTEDKSRFMNCLDKFVENIKLNFTIPIVFINEDYTSTVASQQLNEQNIYAKQQKNKIDQLSASIILESYFLQNKYDF